MYIHAHSAVEANKKKTIICEKAATKRKKERKKRKERKKLKQKKKQKLTS